MSFRIRPTANIDPDELAEFNKEFVVDDKSRERNSDIRTLVQANRSPISYDDIKEDLFTLWGEIAIHANKLAAADMIVDAINGQRSRYAVIEAATGVPWYVVATIHSLEASLNFNRHLHNGDPLTARTVHEPAGRPAGGKPPFTWEESAIDAIRFDGFDNITNWKIERILYTLERFNGFGYRKHHPEVKTPYLWSFSNHYTKGKYVADGKWSPGTVSRQCGAAVLLRRMIDRGIVDKIDSELENHFRALNNWRDGGENDLNEGDEDRFAEDTDTFGSITSQGLVPPGTRPGRVVLGDAQWPTDPANAPDTWHLPPEFQNADFKLTGNVIEALVAAGHFEPDTSTNGRFVLSLRGCAIADGSDSMVDVKTANLKAVKPDHENFRCLIGCYDMNTRLISLYIASTVPRRTGMLKFYNKINFHSSGRNCNMLPTGCYEYCVGTHGGSAGPVSYVLRLGDGPTRESAGEATVLRTVNDLTYGTKDMWDNTRPADNIHPAFLATSFSSLGCLTLRGSQTPGSSHSTAIGEWKAFRQKVGFNGANHGRRFDNLMVTGHEAAAIAAAVQAGSSMTGLECLRQGSRGIRVKLLQTQLGLSDDGVFGSGTCQALVTLQQQKLGFATGTWSASMAKMLNLEF